MCKELKEKATPQAIKETRDLYEKMVRSTQEGASAQFWGPGLMVFGTHRLQAGEHSPAVELRTLPTIEALEFKEWKQPWGVLPTCGVCTTG